MYGAGLYSDGSTVYMYGGAIDYNYTANANLNLYGGGVRNTGTFIMSGGSISYNKADNGGGMSVPGGKSFTMTGGSMIGNTLNGSGSGTTIRIESSSSCTIGGTKYTSDINTEIIDAVVQ